MTRTSKLVISTAALVLLSVAPLAIAFAAGTRGGGLGDVPQGGGCTATADCQQSGTPLSCFPSGNGQCTPTSSLGLSDQQPGQLCTNDNQCADVNGQQYGCYPEGNGTCTLNGDAPTPIASPANPIASPANPIASPATPIASPSNSSTGVGLQNPLNVTSLPDLLREVLGYVITLGTIALTVMLVYVGFLFVAAQGKSEKVLEARQALVWTIIGGLLLLGAQALSLVIATTIQSL